MNYRHEFHAGNFADVMKHFLLITLLQALNRKSAAWCYLDTHAGAGCYELGKKATQTGAEARGGIGRLWPPQPTAPAGLRQLCAIVAAINDGLGPTSMPAHYPGSATIAATLARPQDRLVLAELNPAECQRLRERFRADKRIAVHARDGYELLRALVPPPERRGLVLMDPPYERSDEYTALGDALETAQDRWPGGIYALWYPMKDATAISRFYRRLSGTHSPTLAAELQVARPAARLFSACGVVVVNPPWQCDAVIQEVLRYLAGVLGVAGAGYSDVRWLVPESVS